MQCHRQRLSTHSQNRNRYLELKKCLALLRCMRLLVVGTLSISRPPELLPPTVTKRSLYKCQNETCSSILPQKQHSMKKHKQVRLVAEGVFRRVVTFQLMQSAEMGSLQCIKLFSKLPRCHKVACQHSNDTLACRMHHRSFLFTTKMWSFEGRWSLSERNQNTCRERVVVYERRIERIPTDNWDARGFSDYILEVPSVALH